MTATRTDASASSLRARVALGSALLVALPVTAAALAALLLGGRVVDRAVRASLSRSGFVHERFQTQRAEQLALISQVVASDPAFASYVAEAAGTGPELGEAVGTLSIVDLLAERQAALGFDFAIVLDPRGAVLARTDRPGGVGDDLSTDPLVARALDELMPVTGLWPSGRGLYQAAVVPLASRLDLIGFLVTGLAVDDLLAAEMSRAGGTEVLFVGVNDEGPPVVLASSLDLARSEQALRELRERPELLRDALERGRAVPQLELEVGGERLVGRLDPLADAAGRTLGAMVPLTSLDRERLPFLKIRQAILGAGLLSMAVAVTLAFALASRTLRPVRRLAEAAEAASGGDYSHDLPLPPTDELRRMARAFNRLLVDLRERRAMGSFVAEIASHLPEPLGGEDGVAPDPAEQQMTEHLTGTQRGGDDPAREVEPGPVRIGPGARIAGRYEILAAIGAGGMGRVFKARDDELGELVALKFLHATAVGSPDHLERIKREITLARKITHPNVLRTYDFGEHHGVPYLSMEYVRGLPLDYLLRHASRIPLAAVLYLFRQLCDGLAAAHGVGILHRDIKPGNLIVDSRGQSKLMDFGLAAPIHGAGGGRRVIAGTWLYLAPEVFDGAEPDVRSDLYAVGCVMYEVLTGSPPVESDSMDRLREGKRRPPRWPPGGRPDVPRDLEAIVLGCLDPDPAGRPHSAGSLRDALDRLRP